MTGEKQLFTLTAPGGSIIARGSLDALMERLPDTHARKAALDEMLRTAADAVAAEERQEEARRATVQLIAEGVSHLAQRFDAYLQRRDEQQRREAVQAEAEAQARVQAMLDALPDPDDPEPLPGEAGGELRPLAPPNKEKYSCDDPDDPAPLRTDEPPPRPVLSYPSAPLSNVKGGRDAEAFDPLAPGTDPIDDPQSDPAARGYPPEAPRAAREPTAISFNED